MEGEAVKLLADSGITKKSHLETLIPSVGSFLESMEAVQNGPALQLLHRLGMDFNRAFLMGSEKRYWNFVASLSSLESFKEAIGEITIVHAHHDFKAENLPKDYLKDPVTFLANLPKFIFASTSAITDGQNFGLFSSNSEFEVINEGAYTKQKVFAGQHLTGWAAVFLGPAGTFRDVGKDSRRSYFVATDKDWQFMLPLDPEKTGDADKAARKLKALISGLGPTESAGQEPALLHSESLTEQLEKLVGLHRQGILSDEEFVAAKKKLLD